MTHEHAHDHAAFRESIAVALTGGLSAAEQAGFDAHRAACAECAAEFERARDAEARIAALLAPELPGAGFEDRMIQRLRESASSARDLRIWRPNWRIHPALGKAVAGVAAAIVLGGVGYAVNGVINPGGRNFTSTKNLSYSYQNPYPTTQAMGSGFKLNNALGTEFAVAGDALDRFAQADQAGLPVVPVRSGGEKTVYFEDGHRSDDFGETRGDAAGRGESAVVAGRPVDANLGRPPLNLQQQSAPHGWFKPTELATGQPANPPSAGSVIIPGQTPAITEGAEPQAAGGRRSGRGSTVTATDQPASGGIAGTAGGVTLVPAPPPAAGERAIGQQRGQQSEERQRTVADLETQAERLNAEGRPAEARAVAEQIRVLDPENRLALAAANLPTAPRAADAAAATQPAQRRVIRNGEMSFEVDRFDSAFAQVSKLTSEAGGFVGTSSSQKLPNGKVQGKVALRVAPDRLDTLVLQLRGIGDLTSQSLEAQDVSKRYTDLESQLRAARAMEDRLIAIIKEGKGQIKDLLAAEKELGVWRTKVEELTGEMKYYDNLVAMATLNLTLTERDIATPATARESENVDAGIESEDVEQARAAALKAIEEAKGRVVQSELKRYDAGQFGATIVADVPPDAAGPLLDRLKQIGKVARLDVQRKQTADDSKPRNAATNAPVRVERRDTRFNLLIYNLANVAPRETTTLSLAADDVEKGYQAIRDRVTKAGGRILSSNLNRQKPEQTTGTIAFEVPSAEADAVTNDLRAAGEAMTLTAAANPDVQNVTTAKRGFNVSIIATAAVTPRETATIQLAAPDVAQAREKILAVATTQAAHIRAAALNENDRQNVTATLELDVKRTALPAVEKALADAGQVVKRTSSRAADAEHTLDTKVRLSLTLLPADRLPPRETTTLTVELKDVESAMTSLQTAASEAGGRVVVSTLQKDRDGRGVARVAVDVPLDKSAEIVRRARELGVVRAIDASKDLQVPPGPLARARVDLTFANADTLVAPERGVFASIRRGLSTSLAGLMRSLELIIIGVCFVLPWALVVYAIWRLIKRRRATTEPTPAPA